jgi:hypothetical protein
MKFKGPLGFNRLSGLGPFTFKQNISEYDEIRKQVAKSVEEHDIDVANPTEDDVILVVVELAEEIYPTNENRQELFMGCMATRWVHDWTEGFTQVTTGQLGALEKVVFGAKGCIGWAEFGAIPQSEQVPPAEFLDEDEE